MRGLLLMLLLAAGACQLPIGQAAGDLASATEDQARLEGQEARVTLELEAVAAENARLSAALEAYQDELREAEEELAGLTEASAERDAALARAAAASAAATQAQEELDASTAQVAQLMEDRERIILERGRAEGRAAYAEERLGHEGEAVASGAAAVGGPGAGGWRCSSPRSWGPVPSRSAGHARCDLLRLELRGHGLGHPGGAMRPVLRRGAPVAAVGGQVPRVQGSLSTRDPAEAGGAGEGGEVEPAVRLLDPGREATCPQLAPPRLPQSARRRRRGRRPERTRGLTGGPWMPVVHHLPRTCQYPRPELAAMVRRVSAEQGPSAA